MPDERQEIAAVSGVELTTAAVVQRHHRLPVQLFRFVVTGGLSAIVDFGILVLLMQLGLSHTPAKAISFICGTTTAYLINRRWTFRAEHTYRRFFSVMLLYGCTFFVQVGLFAVLFPLLKPRLPLIADQVIAFVVAQGVATTVNFIVQRVVIFRHRHPHA